MRPLSLFSAECMLCTDSVRKAIHFFVKFDIFEWLYLAHYWVYLHQSWEFCKAWSALYGYICGSIVANPKITHSYLVVEIRQCLLNNNVYMWFSDVR